jgi:hypothetical protein
MSIVGDIINGIVRGAVTKSVAGFVANGDITADQEAVLVEGIMLEIQIALDIYKQSQAKKP